MKHKLKLGFSIGVAAFALSACSKHEPAAANGKRVELPSVRVQVVVAAGQELPVQVGVTGVVRAKDRASIAPKVMGAISAFPVSLGQSVKAGELLVRIDAAEITARVLQAEAQLKQASRDLEREKTLLEKGASTSEIVKNLADRENIMKAMLDEAYAMRGYMELRAPFDGVVARIFSDVGSLAAPGMPLLEIEGSNGFEIEAAVPESLVSGLKIGSNFPVALPSSNGSFQAELTEVSSGFDAYTRTVTARFSLPTSTAARAGQFAKLTLSGEARPAILVPEAAVSRMGQMQRVFVVREGAAHLRLVKTGIARGGKIEIVSGLDGGEQVVVGAESGLTDGQAVSF